MKIGEDRVALFAGALLILTGYLAVFRPAEAQIAQRYAQLDEGRLLLDEELAANRRSSDLVLEEHRLEAWLAQSGARASRTTVVNHFLQTVASLARHDRIAVTGIAAEAPILRSEPSGAAGAAARTTAAFGEVPLSLSLRGTYRDVLHLVADLDETTLAIRIGLDTLENAQRDQQHDPELRARLRITLLYQESTQGGPHGAV